MTESVMVMRRDAQRLSGKISLTEEIVRSKNCDNCFLLRLRNDGDLLWLSGRRRRHRQRPLVKRRLGLRGTYIDADDGDRAVEILGHGVLLVFGAPCQLRSLAGQEHGRSIPLADTLRSLRDPGYRCSECGVSDRDDRALRTSQCFNLGVEVMRERLDDARSETGLCLSKNAVGLAYSIVSNREFPICAVDIVRDGDPAIYLFAGKRML
jgi:hypothetical protein